MKRLAIGREKSQAKLARKVGRTTNHASQVFDYWEKLGIIEKKSEGRSHKIEMTDKGKEIYSHLIKCQNLINNES